MAESVEYRALLECSDDLVTALKFDPMTLGMELAARSLVPPRDVSYRRTTLEQAQELAGSILDRVKLAPSRYRDFVEIVSRHQWMEDFVETLENTYPCDEFSCDLTDIPHGKSSSLDISNPVVRFSDLDEDDREDLLAQIDELTEKIELEFGKLIDRVLSSFWDSGVDHNRVTVTLIGKEKLLKEEDLTGTRNIDDVFKIIRPYCSYFNYDLIETLIQIHGSQQAKAYFKKYIQAFSSYCRAIPCVEEMCGNEDKKSKRTKLKFKLDFDRQQLKPDAVRSIKRKIAKQLGMRPSALFLCGIKEGCILLEFLVPTFIAEQLFPLSKAQRIGLQRNTKALSVECEALNVNIELNIKPGSKKATSNSHSDNSSQTSDTVGSPYKFIRWMRHAIALKSKETQLGRKLRRTFSRDPEGELQHYRPQDSSPGQLDIEIQGTDTPPMAYTGPDSAYMANGNSSLETTTIDSGYSGSIYSGISGVSASVHSQHIQHLSPHVQPIPVYQPALQSYSLSPSNLAVVQFALMHNRHCQIPGCCCQVVRELVEGNRGRIPYNSPEMSVSSSGSSGIHRVNQERSSDSGYDSCTDRRLRPRNLRLLSNEHNRNPNLHPHYHLTTRSHMGRVSAHAPVDHQRSKSLSDLSDEYNRNPNLHPYYHLTTRSHMQHVSIHAPVDHRRSKSLSDLTKLTEVLETPTKTPAIGGSVKAGTPVYYCPPTIGEDGQEKPTSPVDCRCTNQPMLLREISISADNIPALCLNDCPFTPSPLKEGCHVLAGAPGRRSFRRASMRSTKPKLKTVKEKSSSGESDDSNTSSRLNTPIKSSQSDDEGIDMQSHHSQELKSSSLHKHTKIPTDTTLTNKAPVDTAHQTLVDSAPKSSLGMESSHFDRSLDDEVKEIMQSAPARDIQKTAPSHSPLLGRKRNESTNPGYLLSNSIAMSDPRMRRSISPLSIGSSSQVSVHSRRSTSPYETEIRKQNGIVTETTEC